MCKGCQLCLESWYWNCCEERFCYDESIAHLGDDDWGCTNKGASLDSVAVTHQPWTSSAMPPIRDVLQELPIMAPNILEVFGSSMIFKNDLDTKYHEDDEQHPNKDHNHYNGKVVTFQDNNGNDIRNENHEDLEEKKFSDFEIMFQDELYGDHKIFKIEEEEEDEPIIVITPESDHGLAMKDFPGIISPKMEDFTPSSADTVESVRSIARENSIKSILSNRSTISREDSNQSILSAKSILREDSSKSILSIKSILKDDSSKNNDKNLLKDDSNKSIERNLLREDSSRSLTSIHKHILREASSNSITNISSPKNLPRAKSALYLPRTDSVKSFGMGRSHSRQDLLRRVDSAKNLENKNFKNVLARLPQRSASFLNVPQLEEAAVESKAKSDDVIAISSEFGEHSQISHLPDTPVIRGEKLPRFFVLSPEISEYKAQTSLQSIAKTPDVIFAESDYSMPRYYGAKSIASHLIEPAVHSKSMPDLHQEVQPEKVSKRLVKFRSKLKPLVIKKHDHHHHDHHHHHHHKDKGEPSRVLSQDSFKHHH